MKKQIIALSFVASLFMAFSASAVNDNTVSPTELNISVGANTMTPNCQTPAVSGTTINLSCKAGGTAGGSDTIKAIGLTEDTTYTVQASTIDGCTTPANGTGKAGQSDPVIIDYTNCHGSAPSPPSIIKINVSADTMTPACTTTRSTRPGLTGYNISCTAGEQTPGTWNGFVRSLITGKIYTITTTPTQDCNLNPEQATAKAYEKVELTCQQQTP